VLVMKLNTGRRYRSFQCYSYYPTFTPY